MPPTISLSAAVRANLSALQDTSALQAATQERLASGRKVNSALDNPTSYFTAAALSARAVELTQLLDAMTNGINTLKAADNGLNSIAATVESMQATVIQARQDATWHGTTYGLDPAAIGIAGPKVLTLSGGAIGSAPVPIALNVPEIIAAPTASSPGVQFSAIPGLIPGVGGSVVAANAYDGTNAFSAGHVMALRFDPTHSVVISFVGSGQYTLANAIARINQTLVGYGSTVRASDAGGHLMLANTTSGAASNFQVVITKVSSIPLIYEGGFASGNFTTTNGTDEVGSVGYTIAVNGGVPQAISVDPGDLVAVGVDATNGGFNSINMAAASNAKLAAAGITDVRMVKSGTPGVSAATDTFSLQATTTGPGTVFSVSGIIGNIVGGSVTPGANGGPGSVFTVDQLVASINGNPALTGKVMASNDGGRLQITNLSGSPLTITGIGGSGSIDGSASTGTIAGNAIRTGLFAQFNQLRDQLDKTAADSSFNGVNLLRGDMLKLYFNEIGTSAITIQSMDSTGVTCEALAIGTATSQEFSDNATLDARLLRLQTAARLIASQASAFGSNIAIVQNRETFTTAMVMTLQNGFDDLALADSNQEGAAMLALQTRQQLSVQALSLANEANQAVLRLFE